MGILLFLRVYEWTHTVFFGLCVCLSYSDCVCMINSFLLLKSILFCKYISSHIIRYLDFLITDYLFISMGSGNQTRALYMLGKHSTPELHLQPYILIFYCCGQCSNHFHAGLLFYIYVNIF
jgi:hypothetical protein